MVFESFESYDEQRPFVPWSWVSREIRLDSIFVNESKIVWCLMMIRSTVSPPPLPNFPTGTTPAGRPGRLSENCSTTAPGNSVIYATTIT